MSLFSYLVKTFHPVSADAYYSNINVLTKCIYLFRSAYNAVKQMEYSAIMTLMKTQIYNVSSMH